MKLHYITIVILLISGVTIGMVNFLNEGSDVYSSDVDLSGLDGTEARLEAQQQNAQVLSDEIATFELTNVFDFFNIPYVMVKIGWLSAKSFFGSWATVGTMIIETGEGLSDSGIPIPSWVVPMLISILVFILIAIIVYAFFKWRMED